MVNAAVPDSEDVPAGGAAAASGAAAAAAVEVLAASGAAPGAASGAGTGAGAGAVEDDDGDDDDDDDAAADEDGGAVPMIWWALLCTYLRYTCSPWLPPNAFSHWLSQDASFTAQVSSWWVVATVAPVISDMCVRAVVIPGPSTLEVATDTLIQEAAALPAVVLLLNADATAVVKVLRACLPTPKLCAAGHSSLVQAEKPRLVACSFAAARVAAAVEAEEVVAAGVASSLAGGLGAGAAAGALSLLAGGLAAGGLAAAAGSVVKSYPLPPEADAAAAASPSLAAGVVAGVAAGVLAAPLVSWGLSTPTKSHTLPPTGTMAWPITTSASASPSLLTAVDHRRITLYPAVSRAKPLAFTSPTKSCTFSWLMAENDVMSPKLVVAN